MGTRVKADDQERLRFLLFVSSLGLCCLQFGDQDLGFDSVFSVLKKTPNSSSQVELCSFVALRDRVGQPGRFGIYSDLQFINS
jgi:hypothetical protein